MHKCSIRGTFSFQKVILKNHFPTFILKRGDFSSRLAMFSRNRESPIQRTTVLELWVHCVPPCPTLPTLRWVQVLVLRSLACRFPIVYSHAAIYRCSQVIACSDRSSESPCFGPKEMSRGGAGRGGGGSIESDSRFISANFSFGCTVLHILLFCNGGENKFREKTEHEDREA